MLKVQFHRINKIYTFQHLGLCLTPMVYLIAPATINISVMFGFWQWGNIKTSLIYIYCVECTLDFIVLILSTLLFIALTFNPFLGGEGCRKTSCMGMGRYMWDGCRKTSCMGIWEDGGYGKKKLMQAKRLYLPD